MKAEAQELGKQSLGLETRLKRLRITPQQYQDLKKIFEEPVYFIYDKRFNESSFARSLLDSDIWQTNVISYDPDELYSLFLIFNYCRYRLFLGKHALNVKDKWRKKEVLDVLSWNDRQNRMRSKIVTANMGLVLAMSKHIHYGGVEFTDLISEGSMALLRSVDRFDFTRGYKFSTYACRAILKSFSRIARRSWRYRNLFPTQLAPSLEKDNHIEQVRESEHLEQIEEMKYIFSQNLAQLSQTERNVVTMRFSMNHDETPCMTLKEVGEKLGLSKERVRQIQNKALAKLRHTVEEHLAPH